MTLAMWAVCTAVSLRAWAWPSDVHLAPPSRPQMWVLLTRGKGRDRVKAGEGDGKDMGGVRAHMISHI